MRRVFWLVWLVFVAWFGAVACGLNTQPTGVGSGPDAGASGGTGGGAGIGGGQNNCFPTPDQKFCGGDLCPPKTDPAHGCAGSSCAACSIQNATAVCAADGTCTKGTCNTGFTDCDGNPANGCEINTDSDPTNCGSCGNNCFNDKSATNWVCQSGQCVVSNCAPGKGDCDGNSANACETDLNTDPKNCKFCGNDCSTTVLHATPTCAGGVCGYSTCAAGWADCDGDKTNGCEQDIATDPLHCGGCDSATYACSTANGLPACQGGTCTIGCASGYGNCDGNVKNGCETNLTNNKDHCGSCPNKCSTTNAAPTCSGGQCQLNCKSGFDDCDGNKANGCEANLNTDSSHCGNCSTACTGGKTCKSGSCQCGPGEVDYNGTCCTPQTNAAACGSSCNTTVKNNCGQNVSCGGCSGGQTCNNNTCCAPKTCTDLSGQCGSLSDGCGGNITCNCGSGQTCNGNTCCTLNTCAGLGVQCGTPSDGCGGTLDCGSCGAGQVCSSGSCVCDTGYATCSTSPLQCTAYNDKHCGPGCVDCTLDSAACKISTGLCCYPHNSGTYDCRVNGSVPCCAPGDTCQGNGRCN